jgi:hypothetical protein
MSESNAFPSDYFTTYICKELVRVMFTDTLVKPDVYAEIYDACRAASDVISKSAVGKRFVETRNLEAFKYLARQVCIVS